MSDSLSTYLSDHLAGAKFAIDLLEHVRDSHANLPLGLFAGRLVSEIKDDRSVLESLSKEVGDGGGVLKEATAWLAEKASRLKLQFGNDAGLSEFEVLEVLSIGVLGKLKLWLALSQIVDRDARVRALDLDRLIERAKAQHDEIESRRLEAAKWVFANRDATPSN